MPAAGVEAGAAHLGEVPAGAEIAGTHLGVGLEPAAGQHDRLRRDRHGLPLDIGDDAVHAVVIGDQPLAARLIDDRDAVLLGRIEEALDEPRPAAPGFEREPAPEHELAVVLEGLARIHRGKADALAAHPQQRLLALGDQQLGHVGVAAIVGQAPEIVVIFVRAYRCRNRRSRSRSRRGRRASADRRRRYRQSARRPRYSGCCRRARRRVRLRAPGPARHSPAPPTPRTSRHSRRRRRRHRIRPRSSPLPPPGSLPIRCGHE